jgi:hypothetical protein
LVRSPLPSLPLNPLPAPLKKITIISLLYFI